MAVGDKYILGPFTEEELLEMIKEVDGLGSGLDADLWRSKSLADMTAQAPSIDCPNSGVTGSQITATITNYNTNLTYFFDQENLGTIEYNGGPTATINLGPAGTGILYCFATESGKFRSNNASITITVVQP